MKTGNLDGQGIAQLQNYKFQMLSSAPTTAEAIFYYDTTLHSFRYYNGSEWVDGTKFAAGFGIDATALASGTIAVSTTIASKTDIGSANLTIQRNGTGVGTFSANATSAVTVNISVPTTATEVGALPSDTVIGDGALTIQRNGTSVGSFTANQTSASTINISVPTTASEVGALPDSTVIGDGQTIFKKNGTAFATISANQTSTVNVNYTIPTTASDINAVPTSRKINGHTLTADVTLTASDVGALPDTTTIGAGATTFKRNNTAIGTINANQTSATTINISVPTTASEVGALPSSTTITDLADTTQMAAINSGVTTTVVTQVGTNATDISTINGLIPAQATTANQLADKSFVNSSIQTATANFRGNWATWAAVPTNANDYPEDYAGSKTPTVNDYLVVQDASGYTGETLDGTWRFKYSGTWSTDGKSGWLPEYQVNETPLTSAQLAALNSGITAAGVTQIATNTSAIAGKQDTLTAGANIQINGNTISATDTIYTLPAATTSTLGGVIVGTNLSINNGVLSADAQSITVDTTLSTTSTNPAQNKVITSAIQSNTSAIAAKSSVTFVDWTV